MSTSTIRIITGLVLIVHGIGHAMALFPALNISSSKKWHHRSWLLSGFVGDSVSRVLVIFLFGAAFLGFILAGLGVLSILVPQSAWQTLALGWGVTEPQSHYGIRRGTPWQPLELVLDSIQPYSYNGIHRGTY